MFIIVVSRIPSYLIQFVPTVLLILPQIREKTIIIVIVLTTQFETFVFIIVVSANAVIFLHSEMSSYLTLLVPQPGLFTLE